ARASRLKRNLLIRSAPFDETQRVRENHDLKLSRAEVRMNEPCGTTTMRHHSGRRPGGRTDNASYCFYSRGPLYSRKPVAICIAPQLIKRDRMPRCDHCVR